MTVEPEDAFDFVSDGGARKGSTNAAGGHSSDELLWRRLKEGDRQGLAAIYQAYAGLLTQYGVRLIRDKELVRDAVQDLFVQLWERREKLGEARSIQFYLFASLRREIVRRSRLSHTSVDELTELESEDSPETRLIEKQHVLATQEQLSRAVDHLPPRQQEAIFLKYYCELEFSQVAQLMSITPRAVYKLIYKAIDHLQKSLPNPYLSTVIGLLALVLP